MGIFSAILDKLRHHAAASQQTSQPSQSQQQAQPAPGSGTSQQGSPQASIQNVDIDAVLSQLAQRKGGGGNYRESIVDLLKLLDMDSSLEARKQLANELDVHAGPDGSAEQNIALHKAVMKKVAENGGKVPPSMLH